MKKDYIKPLAFAVKVESVSMMAASSLDINKGDTTINTGNGGQLGNKDRGEWGNLWAED